MTTIEGAGDRGETSDPDAPTAGQGFTIRALRLTGICVVMLATALWVTRPLVFGMWDQVWDLGDSLYNIWILDHNYQVFESGQWRDYWHAPIYTPSGSCCR